ncbi:MAG: hypothetical protein JXR62_05120, partial [Bacilli bacterium]|nr:hypothetical protein [Bacilli bacterium]
MEKNALKSFDISSFDIEVKYNQEIAPINESIEALHNELQRKSLHSHKDFLAREKLTIENIEKIRLEQEEQKQILASEKQAELDELQEKKLHIKHELETFIEKTNNENENLFADINNELEALKQSEQDDIQEIENRYNVNVTTQVEIRDFFKSNYDKNMETQQQIIEQYNLLFTEKMVEIDQIKQQTDQMIEEKLAQFSEAKILENKQTTLLFEEVEREFNKDTTNIRKDSNLRAKEIKEMIDGMKKVIHDRYLDYMSILSERRTQIKIDIDERTKLIDKDLEINLEKLNKELSSELDSLSNRTQKSIKMKFDLFNLRAETTKKYEIAFMEEEMLLIADETKYIQKILDDELQNLDKLEIFLLSDQNEIKELGDYFKSINLSLKKELNSFEISNNNYLVKHEVIKAEFIKKYNSLFQQFKKQLVEFNQTKLSQMTKLNQEIDDINLYLDFSDSQKEIQVNDLRKSIEINETKEKYNMLFAKQNHRLSLLNHELSTKIAIEKARINDLCSEIQLQIDVILLKLDLDQQIIEVDANNKELSELHSQRIDNSKFERIILDEKYAKELLVHDYQQQIFELEAKRDNELLLTELEAEIKFAESQTSSKITAIQNQLEQETIQMKETIRAFEFEKESISKNIDTKNTLRLIEFDKQTNHVNVEFDNKVKLIQEALIRETKDAKNSLTQLEHFINERVYKLDFASLTLSDFIQNTDSTLQDEHLSLEDLASTVGKADDMVLQATDFISQSYNVFNQAVDFMFDLERRTLEKKINACSDDSESKKLAKSFQSLLKEQDKKLQYILNTRKENENSIIFEIRNNFEAINKQKSSDKVTYVSELNKIYHDAFETLESFRNNITSEIQIVYSPITQANRDIIDYANEHAAKTISAHDSTRQQDLNQINEELEVFIKEQEALKVQS